VATTTMTTVDNLLKEVYEDGGINDQLQSEVTAIKRVERSGEGVTHEVGGKYVRFPVRTQRNHGIGARNENEALPIPRTQSYASAQVKLKYLYGAMELTGQTFELADKNPQAFASALDQEVNGLKEGLLKDLARQVYGTNKGVMATATAGGTTTTFLLPDANAQYLEIGMFVDVFQSNDAVRVADVTITNITSSAGTTTVTFSPASGTSTASGDYITRDNSVGKEISGFDSIVQSTGVLYNIDPAVTPVWSANVDSNSGTNRALSEGLMINMVDTIRKRGGGVPTAIFAGLGVRRAYFNLLVQQRRITNTQDFAGGFKGLEFSVGANTIPLIEDVDAKPNTMYFMNEKQLKVYEAGDWSFMDRDGSKWQRVITSAGTFDAFDAILFKYMELATHRRNAHGRINDLTEA
jgi:hypothetical protein